MAPPTDPSDVPQFGKFDRLIERYAADLRSHFGHEPDMGLLTRVARSLGPNIFRTDRTLVAASDPAELDRVRAFLTGTLGLPDDDETEAGLQEELAAYGSSNPSKHRAVLYYRLVSRFGKEHLFAPSDTGGPAGTAGETATPSASGGGTTTTGGSGSGGGSLIEGDRKVPRIQFIDAKSAERAARRRLERELRNLRERDEKKSNLSEDEKHKLELLTDILEGDHVPPYALDDTYVALRDHLSKLLSGVDFPNLSDGHFGSGESASDLSFAEQATAAVWSAITGEGVVAPSVLNAISYSTESRELKLEKPSSRFSQAMTAAFSDFTSHSALYGEVLEVMAEAPDVNESGAVRGSDWIAVTRTLIARGVTEHTPSLAGLIRAAIEDRLSPSNDKVTATAQIILPDLEKQTAQEVQRVNLEAAQAVYFAAMMDEARLFDVVDKLAELFQIGALPLERGMAGEYLYRYIRATPDRISPYERRNTYARVFGVAVGDPNAQGAQFRNFDDLWLRFVSAVSDWYRKSQVESLFATNGRYVPSQEQVRKTGLDLAANLSLYCYGGTWFVASELQKNIAEYVDLLSSPEIKRLYGARDMWQVIDQVSVLEFGRPVNTIRARTMANAGATIIGWLEKKSDALSQPGSVLVSPAEIANPPSRSTSNSINDPSDYDLVTACEQWLAVEGVGEDIVDMKASASPSAATQTAPVRVPPAAQEILGAFGFSHDGGAQPGGYVNGSGRAH